MRNDTRRSEKVKNMFAVKRALISIIRSIFSNLEEDLCKEKELINGKYYVRLSKTRLSLRSLRKESLDKIKNLGKGFESE